MRKRIIISGVDFVIFHILGLIYGKNIYLFFMGNVYYKLHVLGPSYVIQIYFQLAAVVAFAGTIPVASWQIWLFVKPALRPHERKAVLAYLSHISVSIPLILIYEISVLLSKMVYKRKQKPKS